MWLVGVGAVVAIIVVTATVAGLLAASSSSSVARSGSVVPMTNATAPATASAVANACTALGSTTNEPVGYRPCSDGAPARNVGVPVYNAEQAHHTYTVTLQTNHGNVVFLADGNDAPYTVFSFVHLASHGYFDATKCHRLTTTGIFVLQCGDPSGTGSGGPGYDFQDENLTALGAPVNGAVNYPAGEVAMANAGPDTNGSQFFLVYKDSPLQPNYTPFGKITQGLDILNQIAAAGSDSANGSGDGRPNESVVIEKALIQQD